MSTKTDCIEEVFDWAKQQYAIYTEEPWNVAVMRIDFDFVENVPLCKELELFCETFNLPSGAKTAGSSIQFVRNIGPSNNCTARIRDDLFDYRSFTEMQIEYNRHKHVINLERYWCPETFGYANKGAVCRLNVLLNNQEPGQTCEINIGITGHCIECDQNVIAGVKRYIREQLEEKNFLIF